MSLTTDEVKEIEELIIQGAQRAYLENAMLTGDPTFLQTRIIESLITINIAQHLLDWAVNNHYQINLEYALSDFYNGAFKAIELGGGLDGTKNRLRKNHNPADNKSGRVDIVITKTPHNEGMFHDPSLMSLVGIEVKSINNSTKEIKKDIERLSTGLNLFDEISKNHIYSCYSIFFRKLDNTNRITTEIEIGKKKAKEKKYWSDYVKNLSLSFTDLAYHIQEIIIEEKSLEQVKDYYDPEDTYYYEVAENTGLVVCYLVKIKRK